MRARLVRWLKRAVVLVVVVLLTLLGIRAYDFAARPAAGTLAYLRAA